MKVEKSLEKLTEQEEETRQHIIEAMIEKSEIEPDFTFEVGSIRIWSKLPDAGQTEDASVESSRGEKGEALDYATREPRFKRFLMAKVFTKIEADATIEFEEGDERLIRGVLARLPQVLFERIWAGFWAKRDAMMLILMGSGDVAKKSQASPSGDIAGSFSESKEESASTEADSPPSTSSS